jgi:hypothetical protein
VNSKELVEVGIVHWRHPFVFDQRRRPWRRVPRHQPSMQTRFYVRLNRAIGAYFSLRHTVVTPCLHNGPELSDTVAHLGLRL